MATITIPKTEYEKLKKQSRAYKARVSRLFVSVLRDSAKSIADDFRATGLYTKEFLTDLEDGLRKSPHTRTLK